MARAKRTAGEADEMTPEEQAVEAGLEQAELKSVANLIAKINSGTLTPKEQAQSVWYLTNIRNLRAKRRIASPRAGGPQQRPVDPEQAQASVKAYLTSLAEADFTRLMGEVYGARYPDRPALTLQLEPNLQSSRG